MKRIEKLSIVKRQKKVEEKTINCKKKNEREE